MLTPRQARLIAQTLPDGQRLRFLHVMFHERVERAHEATFRALDWHRQLQKCTEVIAGVPSVRLVVWSRDCDHYEGWHSYVCPVADVDRRIEQDRAGAEGPMRHHLDRPSITRTLPQGRDHVLEAFEDGHAWSVSL